MKNCNNLNRDIFSFLLIMCIRRNCKKFDSSIPAKVNQLTIRRFVIEKSHLKHPLHTAIVYITWQSIASSWIRSSVRTIRIVRGAAGCHLTMNSVTRRARLLRDADLPSRRYKSLASLVKSAPRDRRHFKYNAMNERMMGATLSGEKRVEGGGTVGFLEREMDQAWLKALCDVSLYFDRFDSPRRSLALDRAKQMSTGRYYGRSISCKHFVASSYTLVIRSSHTHSVALIHLCSLTSHSRVSVSELHRRKRETLVILCENM